MWHSDQFAEYLHKTYCRSNDENRNKTFSWLNIQNQIKRLVWISLL